jgi:hypothetical protein
MRAPRQIRLILYTTGIISIGIGLYSGAFTTRRFSPSRQRRPAVSCHGSTTCWLTAHMASMRYPKEFAGVWPLACN